MAEQAVPEQAESQGREDYWLRLQVADCPYDSGEQPKLYAAWMYGYGAAYDECQQALVDYA